MEPELEEAKKNVIEINRLFNEINDSLYKGSLEYYGVIERAPNVQPEDVNCLFRYKLFLQQFTPSASKEKHIRDFIETVEKFNSIVKTEHGWLFVIQDISLLSSLGRNLKLFSTYFLSCRWLKKAIKALRRIRNNQNARQADYLIELPNTIGNLIDKCYELMRRLTNCLKAAENEIHRIFGKRSYKVIKAERGNRVELNVLFDLSNMRIISASSRDSTQVINFFASFPNLQLEDIFSKTFQMFESAFRKILELADEELQKFFFSERKNLIINLHVVYSPKVYARRSFVTKLLKKMIFYRGGKEFKKNPIEIKRENGRFNIFINILRVEELLKSFLNGSLFGKKYYEELREILIHEMEHLKDEYVFKGGETLLRFREEGLAEFSEFAHTHQLHQKFIGIFDIANKYIRESIPDTATLNAINGNEKEEQDIYDIGLFMCIIIFASMVIKRLKIRGFEAHYHDEWRKLLERKEAQEYEPVFIKLLRRMPPGMFFRKYEKASKKLGLQLVLSKQLMTQAKKL